MSSPKKSKIINKSGKESPKRNTQSLEIQTLMVPRPLKSKRPADVESLTIMSTKKDGAIIHQNIQTLSTTTGGFQVAGSKLTFPSGTFKGKILCNEKEARKFFRDHDMVSKKFGYDPEDMLPDNPNYSESKNKKDLLLKAISIDHSTSTTSLRSLKFDLPKVIPMLKSFNDELRPLAPIRKQLSTKKCGEYEKDSDNEFWDRELEMTQQYEEIDTNEPEEQFLDSTFDEEEDAFFRPEDKLNKEGFFTFINPK